MKHAGAPFKNLETCPIYNILQLETTLMIAEPSPSATRMLGIRA